LTGRFADYTESVKSFLLFIKEMEMNLKTTNQLKKAVMISLVAGLIGLSGCATTGDRDKLQAEIDSVKAEASAARAEAAEAKAMAAEAVGIANEANATSADTEMKIDRMFKKAMHK
jgi:murein lipoprotein